MLPFSLAALLCLSAVLAPASAGAALCLPTCCAAACGGLAALPTVATGGAAIALTGVGLAVCIAECIPIGFVSDFAFCPVPVPACTWCFSLLVCFAEDTPVTVLRGAAALPIPVQDVRPGDLVRTLDELTGRVAWTTVTLNAKHTSGPAAGGIGAGAGFDFVTVTTAGGRAVTVTTDHVMVAHVNGSLTAMRAGDLAPGHELLGDPAVAPASAPASAWSPDEVVGVRRHGMPAKWELATERGTVLAGGLLATTICGIPDASPAVRRGCGADSFPPPPLTLSFRILPRSWRPGARSTAWASTRVRMRLGTGSVAVPKWPVYPGIHRLRLTATAASAPAPACFAAASVCPLALPACSCLRFQMQGHPSCVWARALVYVT